MAAFPSTTALRVVAALAQHGTVSAAAEALHLTQSAVSKQLKSIETLVGLRLFDRSPLGLSPTGAGVVYVEQARIVLGALETAALRTAGLRSSKPVLRLHVLPILGDRWFMQRLPDFSDRHEGIDVGFATFAPRDTFRNVDVVFRFGEGRWPGWDADYFLGRDVALVGSPQSIATAGGIVCIDDVPRHRLLVHEKTPLSWADFFRAHGRDDAGARTTPLGYYALVIRAAIAGQGLALVPRSLVLDELAAGTLVNPRGLGFESRNCYWLTTPSEREPSPELRAFRTWALDAALRTETGEAALIARPAGTGPHRSA